MDRHAENFPWNLCTHYIVVGCYIKFILPSKGKYHVVYWTLSRWSRRQPNTRLVRARLNSWVCRRFYVLSIGQTVQSSSWCGSHEDLVRWVDAPKNCQGTYVYVVWHIADTLTVRCGHLVDGRCKVSCVYDGFFRHILKCTVGVYTRSLLAVIKKVNNLSG